MSTNFEIQQINLCCFITEQLQWLVDSNAIIKDPLLTTINKSLQIRSKMQLKEEINGVIIGFNEVKVANDQHLTFFTDGLFYGPN